jgi:hypothetical protein
MKMNKFLIIFTKIPLQLVSSSKSPPTGLIPGRDLWFKSLQSFPRQLEPLKVFYIYMIYIILLHFQL